MKKNTYYQAPCLSGIRVEESSILCQSELTSDVSTEVFEIGDTVDFD